MSKSYQEIRDIFQNNLNQYSRQAKTTKKRIRKTSILRISLFLLTILGIYIGSAIDWRWVAGIGVVGFALFIWLVIKHAKLFKQKQWFGTLASINQTELDLLDGKTEGKPEGEQYLDHDHPYTSDLDIFGKKSLFQLIDRSATFQGRKHLADRLRHPIKDVKELLNRQEAIAELKDKNDWRQQFQAIGLLTEESHDSLAELQSWSQTGRMSFDKLFYKIMLILNPLIGFSVILLISLNILGFGSFVLFLLLPFGIVGTRLAVINHVHSQLNRKTELLTKYAGLLQLVEDETFSTKMLVGSKKKLTSGTKSAAYAIKKLSKISNAFDYRLNFLVGILLNVFFLWDIIQCIRLEKWKKSFSEYLPEWFAILARIDELNSLAGFAYSHPDNVFPKISEKPFEYKAENIRHPFLSHNACVGNDISIDGWGNFQIITGANMAGKSTYLRTVGINLILAMTGTSVLADHFVFKPVDLYTGIKTSDSLQEGESYFFAELKRLETIIRLLENGNRLFILLDEILRGTNSADKQKGSNALIRQLINLSASGMIATHDLSLGKLAESFPGHVTNKRFEVEIENNELVFDYKLKEGVSRNLNATFLMKKMGITVE